MSEHNEPPSTPAESLPPLAGEALSATSAQSGEWSAEMVDKALGATITNLGRVMVAGVLAANPTQSHTGHGLKQKINDAQTPDSAGRLRDNDAQNVFRQGEELAKAGLAKVGYDPSTDTLGVKVNRKGRTYGPAVGGALVGWQQRHQEVPLNDIVGNDNRQTATHGSTRSSAMVRLAVVEQASQGNVSQAEIAQNLGERSERVGVAIRNLEEKGIVNIDRQTPQRTVTVDPSKRRETDKTRSPAGKAIRKFVQNLAEQNTGEGIDKSDAVTMTRDEFVQKVQEVDPSLSSSDIWKTVSSSGRADRAASIPVSVNPEPPAGDQLTTVTLNPDKAEAVRDLVQTVNGLRTGDQQIIDQGRQTMRDVLTQPQLADQVMAPSQMQSSGVGGTSAKPTSTSTASSSAAKPAGASARPPSHHPIKAAVPTTSSGEVRAAIESQVPKLEAGGAPRSSLTEAAIVLDEARTIFNAIAASADGAGAQCAAQLTEAIDTLAAAHELLGASAIAFRNATARL